jgi:predicted Rossmann fold nucleotide-binding protein DprA/Smf involved in DNA uptake
MSDEDYRLKFSIPVGTPLVCIEWSENQTNHNIKRGADATLTARGPQKGFKQRASVKQNRAKQYKSLAKSGAAAAAKIDKTAARRAKLEPYPVTVDQAAERLTCTAKAAQTFLAYCVQRGKLKRLSKGLYGMQQ